VRYGSGGWVAGEARVLSDRGSVVPEYTTDSGLSVKSQSRGALKPRGSIFKPMMGLIVTEISGSGVDAYGLRDGGVMGPDDEGREESDQVGEGVESPEENVWVSSEKRTCFPGIV
jgi:hypothetical protein